MDDFWQRWQAYSLTFWPNLAVLRRLFNCGRIWRKLKMDDFWQRWQAYSLTFWPNLAVLRRFFFVVEFGES